MKKTTNKIERQPTELEEIFANDMSDKGEIKQNSHMLPVLLYAVSRASRALATVRGLQAVAGMWPERLAEHTAGSLGGCSFSPSNFHVLSNILIFQIFLSSLDSLM